MKTIKFFFPVLMLAFAVSFSSCGSDDPADLIIGTWAYENTTVDVQTNNAEATNFFKEMMAGNEGNASDIDGASITFSADGKATTKNSAGRTDTTSYKFENGKLVIGDKGDEIAYTYSVDKKKLSFGSEYSADELKVLEQLFEGVTITKIKIMMNFNKK